MEQASADHDTDNESGNKTVPTHPNHQIVDSTTSVMEEEKYYSSSTDARVVGDVLFDEISSQERMVGILSSRVVSDDGAWMVTGIGLDDSDLAIGINHMEKHVHVSPSSPSSSSSSSSHTDCRHSSGNSDSQKTSGTISSSVSSSSSTSSSSSSPSSSESLKNSKNK